MAASLSGLSASVTRILFLTGFPKELKTKDIQAVFSEYDGVNGGFKIKWRDDTSLLIVFQDAAVAKRAYLNTLAFPPPILTSAAGISATIRPYDGPDAQTVIQTVNTRGHNPSASRAHNGRAASISVFPNARSVSGTSTNPNNNNPRHNAQGNVSGNGTGNGNGNTPNGSNQQLPQSITVPESSATYGRESSPTLPTLPSHPTLNALISSSLGEAVAGAGNALPSDPAILASSLHGEGAPRIGNPGKRMLGAALGVRHPSLGPRVLSGNGNPGNGSAQASGADQAMREIQRAMGGLVVVE